MGQLVSATASAAQQQESGVPEKKGAWWCRMLARGIGVIGGSVAVITGIVSLITFTPLCLVSGILLMLLGFFVVLLEAPCCCAFLDFIQPITRFSERRPYYQKALLYGIPAILPVALCFTLTSFFGCGLVFASAVFYMMMSVGNKADRETMALRARGQDMEMKSDLINNEEAQTAN
ncbi:calcium channel flower-like [Gigantopelta aegis]|uniref:calcium channel flower-like n=1 Tax=Gigantopelta aegis TaxID=1735272 RepID=UPI001B88899C|nr:calcium channel flower-like [Gigantopelta aegis]